MKSKLDNAHKTLSLRTGTEQDPISKGSNDEGRGGGEEMQDGGPPEQHANPFNYLDLYH